MRLGVGDLRQPADRDDGGLAAHRLRQPFGGVRVRAGRGRRPQRRAPRRPPPRSRTATRSAGPSGSSSASPAAPPAATPRSGTPSPGSSATPSGTASPPSRSRTSTSPTPAPPAGRPWAAAGAASGSARRWPGSPPPSSATGSPPRPHRHGIALWAVNPAYTSAWGDQHWRKPYENVTRHEAAATVIGRRAQGHKARRREGVTRARPEDRAVRATNQAGPNEPRVSTSSRHRPGTRGNQSRPPGRARTRLPGRATVTPASANNGNMLVTVAEQAGLA